MQSSCTNTMIVNGFYRVDEDKIDWIEAFRTDYQWRVTLTNDELKVDKQDKTTGYGSPILKTIYFSPKIRIGNAKIFGTNVYLKLLKGNLLGVSYEWSGGLFQFNDSLNSYKQVKLKNEYEMINSIISRNNEIFVFTDLLKMYKVNCDSDLCVAKFISEFETSKSISTPIIIIVPYLKGDWVILTNNKLSILDSTGKEIKTISTPFEMAWPNSMVVKDHVVYIGMQEYIAEIDLESKEKAFIYIKKEVP